MTRAEEAAMEVGRILDSVPCHVADTTVTVVGKVIHLVTEKSSIMLMVMATAARPE